MAPLSYWAWLFRGRGGDPGWRGVVDWWLAAHCLVGLTLALTVPVRLDEAAKAVLLPMVGVCVAISFAWIGTAYALVQSDEIEELVKRNSGGLEAYIYPFQTAILVLLVALAAWGLAGLGVYDQGCFVRCPAWGYQATSLFLYSLASLLLRECWQVVLASQTLLLYRRAVHKEGE